MTDPATFTQPVTLAKHWVWIPGVEVGRYACVVAGCPGGFHWAGRERPTLTAQEVAGVHSLTMASNSGRGLSVGGSLAVPI